MAGEVWVDGQRLFRRVEHMYEAEFEKLVEKHQSVIFGERVLLMIKRTFTSPIGNTVPDGILLSLKDPKGWAMVEVETAKDDAGSHMLPQITKMITARIGPEDIADLVAKSAQALKARTPPIGMGTDALLAIFDSKPGVVMIIDEASEAVRAVVESTPPTRLIVATPFRSVDGQYGLHIAGALPPPTTQVVLEVQATASTLFGWVLLPVVAGKEALPEAGKIVLKSGKEQVTCKLHETDAQVFVSARIQDVERIVGKVAKGDRLALTPLMAFQVYECKRQ